MASIVDAVMGHQYDARPAVVGPTRITTYAELAELTRRVASGLRRSLTTDDDVCLVVSHPGLEESLALTLAGWSLGRRVAVMPPYLKSRELDHALLKCRPVVTVSDTTAASAHSLAFATLVDGPAGEVGNDAERARFETFTSGTTGHPKCVDRAVSRLSADVEQLATTTGLVATDRVSAMTTALSTTSVLPALWAGATLVSVALNSPRNFWAAVGDQQITVISGTPYAYELAARHRPRADQVAMVRLALTTSARLRPSTARTLMANTAIPIRNIMCSSEAGHIAYNDADEVDLLATSVGRPLPGVELEIRDEDGIVRPDGEPGRICVRSPFTAAQYRNDREETATVFSNDWVVSTDLGFLDARGFLYLTGRNDHRIHFGAAKLDPQELEDVLLRHPGVDDVLVVGENHSRLGQIPVARVVPAGDISAAELLSYCRDELSPTKVPQKIEFVPTVRRDFKGQPRRPAYVRFGADQN